MMQRDLALLWQAQLAIVEKTGEAQMPGAPGSPTETTMAMVPSS